MRYRMTVLLLSTMADCFIGSSWEIKVEAAIDKLTV